MSIECSKHVLLTGAGFTKNFGAPLANEMWAEIFNHKKIQAQPRIKELMLKDFNYESVYYSVLERFKDERGLFGKKGEFVIFDEEEKNAIKDATKSAYDHIDEYLMEPLCNEPEELQNINDLIYHFRKINYKSFIFTLNQDMFFERLYDHPILSIPGIKNNPKWFNGFKGPLSRQDCCKLPDEDELNRNKSDILSNGDFFLIKLHGSYNWQSSDGTRKMVVGGGKMEQIQKEPLLNYYFDIFKKVLFQDQCHLLVIGYGFGDAHINNILYSAMINHKLKDKLKVSIISPESPEDFKERIHKNKRGKDIWNNISGYYPYKLTDMFSKNPSVKTQASKNLYKHHFEQEKIDS